MKTEEAMEEVRRILADEGCLGGLKSVDPAECLIAEGGKLLRPRLVILSAMICGYEGESHTGCAAAVELLHNSTLLHDDIMDRGTIRRGKPTVNARFGNNFALMAGDHMVARSFSLVSESGGAEAALVLADCYRDVIFGQMKEMDLEKDPECVLEDYYTVIENKTAALFRACAEIGAVTAGAEPPLRGLLADIGFCMGKLFQVADDMFDYLAPEEKTGKKRFQDVREGKMTLPLILLLENCDPKEKKFVLSCIGNSRLRDSAGEQLVAMFMDHGIVLQISEFHLRAHDELRDVMERLPDSDYTQEFRDFINGIVDRVYPLLEERQH